MTRVCHRPGRTGRKAPDAGGAPGGVFYLERNER